MTNEMFRLWRDSYERVDIYSRRDPTMPTLLREGIHREGGDQMSEWTKCEVCGRPEIDFCTCKKEEKAC